MVTMVTNLAEYNRMCVAVRVHSLEVLFEIARVKEDLHTKGTVYVLDLFTCKEVDGYSKFKKNQDDPANPGHKPKSPNINTKHSFS